MKNELCSDIGFLSINHFGEQLCGDHVDVVNTPDSKSTIVVLADGLGSGVKASILSTLTAKIISTMTAAGLKLEDCVETIVATLPVCAERGVAYSTFSILRITENRRAEIINYDNPDVIMLRDGKNYSYPVTESVIACKKIRAAQISLREGDTFIMMSDGVEHAGVGNVYNFGWSHSDVTSFLEDLSGVGFTAKTLTTILLEQCNKLYNGKPGDDATVCTVRVRRREPMNLIIGPPQNRNDATRMMNLFFRKEGGHIVCGGTTSEIAAKFLKKPLIADLNYIDPEIPPIATLEGADLVTEGVITVSRVLEYAKDYLLDNKSYDEWSQKQDGASKIARLLFEEATDINFFVGRAVNPAHQNPALPINFNIKMRLIEELSDCLKKMGKTIKVSYF